MVRTAHRASRRRWGYVADIFDEGRLARLPGSSAIGHVRYSTTGESLLENAQPIVYNTNKGPLAIAHNGNLVNADEIRAELEEEGSIFTTSSDTEVFLHLMARSRVEDVVGALREALARVRGAYSIVLLAKDRVIAARDPQGVRPLTLGRLRVDGAPDARVVASETCAFDLIDAEPLRDVEPGEIVVFDPGGTATASFAMGQRTAFCIFEHVYFARPDSSVFGKSVAESRRAFGRRLAREHPVPADVVVPVPDSGVFAALGFAEESGIPYGMGLVRNHYVGRTFIEPKQAIRHFGVKVKLNPVRSVVRRQAHRARGRFDRARHDVEEDRQDAQGRGGERGPHAHLVAAHDEPVPLRDRHAAAERAHRRDARPRIDAEVHRGRLARIPLARGHAHGVRARTRTRPARPASRAGIRFR